MRVKEEQDRQRSETDRGAREKKEQERQRSERDRGVRDKGTRVTEE